MYSSHIDGILWGTMSRIASINPAHGFHVLTKPIGPICNLDCKYCFYLEKEKLYPDERKWAMSDEVLETYVRQYIEGQAGPESLLCLARGRADASGRGIFRKAADRIQRKYADGKQIFNALQTNGTLLDDGWCAFFAEQKFFIGLSIDGPAELHDVYRVDKNGMRHSMR